MCQERVNIISVLEQFFQGYKLDHRIWHSKEPEGLLIQHTYFRENEGIL